MKKVLFFLILIMTLSLSLFACGGGNENDTDKEICEVCTDSDGNGFCDVCKSEVAPIINTDLELFVEGKPTFNIVMADDLPSKAVSAVRLFQYNLETYHKKTVSMEYESKSSVAEIEVLVGNVKSRGEKYSFDGYSLGNDGYIIKLIDTKVIINAGSEKAFSEVMKKFSEDIIGTTGKKIFDVTMTAEDSIEFIQSEFDITSLKIDGVDIREFKICANSNNKTEKKVAEQIRNTLYLKTGAYLEIVSDSSGENLIHIKKVSDGNFTVAASNKKLTVSYSHENLLEQMVTNFLTEEIEEELGAVSFSDEIYKKDTTVVYYEYFGAVGDGKTDDFEVLYRAHEAANEGGQPVKATPGKTYYIKNTVVDGTIKSITIRTNVDWTGAKFIIDDTDLIVSDGSQGKNAIFKVMSDSDLASIKITDKDTLSAINAERIGPKTNKIVLDKEIIKNWDGPVMLVLYNSTHKVYRRRNYGGYKGETQKELVILESDGTVSTETPIMFDYNKLTQAYIYRLDDSRAITIEGGEITTIATKEHTAYVSRNMSITRPYTTVRGVKHFVEGEVSLLEQARGKMGATYSAFFAVSSCTDVTLEDCVLTGRRYYDSGTYEFSANTANKVRLDGCTQSNFWVTVDENYDIHPATKETVGAISSQSSTKVEGKGIAICWGAGSSNFCKNLEYKDSQISRFDAHAGVYNGRIIGCDITGIELTGWGELIIEDTNWYSYGTGSVANSLIYLRNDYGSTWNGTIKIKDVNAYFTTKKEDDSYLFYHSYVNWYFGYTSVFPSVEIDNLKCHDVANKANEDILLDEGYEIRLTNGSHISGKSMFHLPYGNKKSNYSIVDADGDKFVDEPIMDRDLDGKLDEPCDLDGDGKIGNTSILCSEAKAAAGDEVDKGTYYGDLDQDSTINAYVTLNIVVPPKRIKILNNTGKGSFVLRVKNTAGEGTPDGGHHDDVESWGGFFGDTKFYYGTGENDYFIGTDYVGQDKTNSFEFYN